MPPTWLTIVAWASLVVAFATAAAILYDIYGRGHRQKMGVMEAVWPITALYLGPLAWLAYRRWGRLNSPKYQRQTGAEPEYDERVSVGLAVSHCGAGCTLGDIVGAWVVFAAGWKLLGLALPAEYIVDFALAFTLGIAFQYFSIAPMRNLRVGEGIRAALKADTLSLTAFEVGLFGQPESPSASAAARRPSVPVALGVACSRWPCLASRSQTAAAGAPDDLVGADEVQRREVGVQDVGDLHRVGDGCWTAARPARRCWANSATFWAMNCASSLTQPSSAEPRVCCHGNPSK